MDRTSNIISDYKIDLRVLRARRNIGYLDEYQYQTSKRCLTKKFLVKMGSDHEMEANFVIEEMESELSKDDEFSRRLLNI